MVGMSVGYRENVYPPNYTNAPNWGEPRRFNKFGSLKVKQGHLKLGKAEERDALVWGVTA